MSPKANESTNSFKNTIIVILILLLFFALQYWKPSYYWNSPRRKFERELIGDRGLDILIYGLVTIFFLGIMFRFLKNIFIRCSSKHEISKDIEE